MKQEISKELAEEQEWFHFNKYMKSKDSTTSTENGEENGDGENNGKKSSDSINERKSRRIKSRGRHRSVSTRSRSLSVDYRHRSLSRQSSFSSSRRSSSIDIYGKKHSKHSKDVYSIANLTFDSKTSKKNVIIIL